MEKPILYIPDTYGESQQCHTTRILETNLIIIKKSKVNNT